VNRIDITVVLAVMLGASAATAKEPPQTAVCGRSIVGLSNLPTARACLKLSDRDEVVYQLLDQGEPFALRSRPRPAPFYTPSRFNSRTPPLELVVPVCPLARTDACDDIRGDRHRRARHLLANGPEGGH
jgi:hypothetical protein